MPPLAIIGFGREDYAESEQAQRQELESTKAAALLFFGVSALMLSLVCVDWE
jgi:hypothetical protein